LKIAKLSDEFGQYRRAYLPADPKTIRAFIQDRVTASKKPATVKRYVATIARVHVAAGLLNPCSSEAARMGLKKMGRETSARQDQAHPLGWKEIKEFIESASEIESVPCSVSLTKPSLDAGRSWRWRFGISIFIPMARDRH
jgi:hypothetical protein